MDTSKVGTTAEFPAPENTCLREEISNHVPGTRFSRVLISFKITDKNGTLISLSLDQLKTQDFAHLEVVGVIGTILGKEGLFGQCGWFGDNDLDWMWVRILSIKGVVANSDIRFRQGEICVWLTTAHGDYAMELPHQDYYDLWEQTLFNMRSLNASCTMFEMWPQSGYCPTWWDERWKESWPFDKPVLPPYNFSTSGSKRRKSPDSDVMDVDIDCVPTGDRGPSASTSKWQRLQAGSDETNFPQRRPWVLVKDGGLQPDRKGKKRWDKACSSSS